MSTPPIIFVADRRSLKTFASEGPGASLRLINAISIPESHRLTRDGLARETAGQMADLLQTHQPSRWAFAAPADINGAILERVSRNWLTRLQDNRPKDLHQAAPHTLREQFQQAGV